MIIFRVILLFFILISPLKANTIYNLIKIPNLEIYEINTENKLKYFYAASSFRLGVQKNIICLSSNKKNYDEKYQVIERNLKKYSHSFLKKINLKYIVMCENLSISGINTAGIPDNVMKTLILDIEFNKKYFERVIHHEIFHIINDQYRELFNENNWKEINTPNFVYAECSTCTEKLGLNTYTKKNGFFTEYSKSTVSEDMAEVYSHLIFLDPEEIKQIRNSDKILKKKISYIEKKIKLIDNSFSF
ncbi:hypothetical protein IDH10_01490 [Pelagibacterales bacterium SAG-MED20]|nr:hypothetical protein [Pelagibacterales bacterium SAG-MED20]